MKDSTVTSRPDVQALLAVRDAMQFTVFASATFEVQKLLKGEGGKRGPFFSVLSTMWGKYNGKDIGELKKPTGMRWCQKHRLLPSKAKLDWNGAGGNVIQFVLRMNHLSNYSWPAIKTQLAAAMTEIKEEATLKELQSELGDSKTKRLLNSKLRTPSEATIRAIEVAFRQPGLFTERISKMLKSLPEHQRNAKKQSVKKMKGFGGGLWWGDYERAGLTEEQFRGQISRLVGAEKQAKKNKSQTRGTQTRAQVVFSDFSVSVDCIQKQAIVL